MAKLISGLGKHKATTKTKKLSQSAQILSQQQAQRAEAVKVKTASKRKISSTSWLQRQLNDPYVQEAQRQGYHSRAAFKLLEIDADYHLLKSAKIIVDLGAAPGGWLQVAKQICAPQAKIIGCDLLEIEPVTDIIFIKGDFTDETIQAQILQSAGGKMDLLLSDISPNMVGHKKTDIDRMNLMAETIFDFAYQYLSEGGTLICKTRKSGMENDLQKKIKQNFSKIHYFKPQSSRAETSEIYLVAIGFSKADS